MSKKEAAQQLGISTASISNWVRHGYITNTNNMFEYNEILSIKNKLETGKISRLNKRANKSNSNSKFMPAECITSKKSIPGIVKIVSYIHNNNIPIDQALFLLTLNLFIKTGDIFNKNPNILFRFQESNFKRKGVYEHIKNWSEAVSFPGVNHGSDGIKILLSVNLPEERDISGIIYQSLLSEGQKSDLGSYYTPEYVVKALVKGNLKSDFRVLDPCCGTGQFLLSFSEDMDNPNNIYGFDIDERAINIAKTNLLLCYQESDFSPRIFHLNTLLPDNFQGLLENESEFDNFFDFIATNPPWGARYDKITLSLIKRKFPGITGKESASFFICKSFSLLKEGGIMSFVLPESISNIKAHGDIRKFINRFMDIKQIHILGKCFSNVLSSVISIQLKKEKKDENRIKVFNGLETYSINQQRFARNKYHAFDIYVNEMDSEIFSKMEDLKKFTLENNAEWALGIVTGDNKKFLHSSKTADDLEAIYKGSDIQPFRFRKASTFISFKPELFQQAAPAYKYRSSEKLVYKFISRNLVFAYDNKGSLTLNSANILIPEVSGYPMKIISGFLNSKIFNFYFRKKFNSIKTLRSNIEQLPFPEISEKQKTTIENLVNDIIDSNVSSDRLDSCIFNIFNIDQKQREYINKYVNG